MKSTESEVGPAEVFPLAEYLCEEILARGWTTLDVALRMGGTSPEVIGKDLLVVDLLMCVHKDNLIIPDDEINALARAFDVNPQFFRNLDNTWRKWPDRRAKFTPPESIFGPISRRALIHVVPQQDSP